MSVPVIRLAFAGTPDLAATILEFILKESNHAIDHVYTQPDRPAGRGKKINACAVKTIAEKNHLQVYQPEKSSLFDPDNRLSNVDLLVVAAYGLLLPEQVLNRPKYGCINIHTSLLPKWRGAAPIQRAIEAGDKETGITIMQMDKGLDTGDILLQKSCTIDRDETTGTLHNKLAVLGAKCIVETLDQLDALSANPLKQNENDATYAEKITKEEACIDWSKPAIQIERAIRAFNPAPGAYTTINNLRIKVWDACVISPEKHDSAAPGTIIESDNNGITIQSGDGLIRIKKIQLPGKKAMMVSDFLNGNPGFFKNMITSG